MASISMPLTDEQLVTLYQSGGDVARSGRHANELLTRYSERVVTWCLRFCGDREVARDLAQDVLLKAYRHLGAFRSDAKFSTWLYSITRNHCLNYVRERATEPEGNGEPIENDILDHREWDSAAEMERRQMVETVRELVMETLDETEMQVMMLHYGEEMPVASVTRVLGLKNASGAKAFLVSAKRKLGTAWRRVQARQANPLRRPQ